MRGPAVRLPPKHALTLTLTLHELATNAAKYGALANPDGKLSIDWMVTEDGSQRVVTLNWEETGVRRPLNAPIREGFGTRLIKNGVVYDLQGACEYRLDEHGVHCKLTVPF